MVLTDRARRTPQENGSVPPPAQRDFVTRLDAELSGFVAAGLAIAWAIFVGISLSVQPPPPDPAPAPDALSLVISTAFMVTMLTAISGLGLRRSWGAMASVAGGGVLMMAATTCYLTGHTGAWIAVQFLAGLGLAVVSAATLKATAR